MIRFWLNIARRLISAEVGIIYWNIMTKLEERKHLRC